MLNRFFWASHGMAPLESILRLDGKDATNLTI